MSPASVPHVGTCRDAISYAGSVSTDLGCREDWICWLAREYFGDRVVFEARRCGLLRQGGYDQAPEHEKHSYKSDWRTAAHEFRFYQRGKILAVFRWLRSVIIVVAVLSSTLAFGQTKAGAPVKTVRLTGQVTDRVHEPIVNAAVALKVAPATPPGFSVGFTRAVTTTDLNGRFTFPAVPPGGYVLRFESSGYAFLERGITATKDIELTDVVLEVAPIESPIELPLYAAPIGQKLDDDAEEPIMTTLCELVKTPERFNGQLVQIRAEYVSKFHWTGLKDGSCSASIPLGTYHPVDDLKPGSGEFAFTTTTYNLTYPEGLKWQQVERRRSVRLIQDQHYKDLQKFADAKFRWKDGGLCLDCPLYRIRATVTGRFDYFETQTVAVRESATDKPFLHATVDSNSPLSRLVLQSVEDVTATPIAPSTYSENKPRVISLEEASDVLFALLKTTSCSDRTCTLDDYRVKEYPRFYFFAALWDNPNGSPLIGHYAVDVRTGDVWNAVICERFKSPALAILQHTIRERIGLTDVQYRKLRTDGPQCE